MCNNESYQDLSQPAHFFHHAMLVEKDCSAVRLRGLGSVSVEHAMQEANDALALVDGGVPPESRRWLSLVAVGDLQTAADL